MNSGIIASRYAKALFKYIKDKKAAPAVYAQAGMLAYKLVKTPNFRDYIQKHVFISGEEKMTLMEKVLGEPLVPEFRKFIELVIERKRIDFLTLILSSFIEQYEKDRKIRSGTLVVARPVEGLTEKLESLLDRKVYSRVCLHVKEDPSIIGGFIFDLDCLRLDASVRRKLALIRNGMIEKNNRII